MPFTMVDLCAGIGGMRKGFELTGHFINESAAEIDKFACLTYHQLYGDDAYHDLTTNEYKELLDEGIITKEEFEKKKKDLLNV